MTEVNRAEIEKTLELVADSFREVLYEDDETFLENMKSRNVAGDDISRYRHWEWTQGVGLFGFWKLYRRTGREEFRALLEDYYTRELEAGLPGKNINTVTPLLALSFLAEYNGREDWLAVCDEWAGCIMEGFPRTEAGGLQHCTSDSINLGELWDDTLFMTVLFLANMGRIRGRQDYLDEAAYQFLLHARYLTDRETGLWFHGWTFEGRHNFARALWGRGNSWVTLAIPEFLEIARPAEPVRRVLEQVLRDQIESLLALQDKNGMWHTLLDDPDSYTEASATCGIACGMIRAAQLGIVPRACIDRALRAVDPILKCVSKDGKVGQVSYGTPMGRESRDFYKQIPLMPMPYGQALAILFLMEAMEV